MPLLARRGKIVGNKIYIQGILELGYLGMSPTVFYYKNYRFFFFSREESRMHIHVYASFGEAKFWIEPEIELAVSKGFNSRELKEMKTQIKSKEYEIRQEWIKHFGSNE